MKKTDLYGMAAIGLFCIAAGVCSFLVFFGDPEQTPAFVPGESVVDYPEEQPEPPVIVGDLEGDRGQEVEPDVPEEPAEVLGSVEGTVFDETGRPVEEARLSILRSRGQGRFALRHKLKPLYRTRSGRDGAFSIGPLYPGTGYAVIVEHDLFAERMVENISVAGGAATQLPPIVLRKGKTAYGWVRDDKGNPLTRARVAVYGGFQGASLSDPDVEPERMALTDEKGRYRITNIKHAGFFISASARGFETGTQRNRDVFSRQSEFKFDFLLAREKSVSGVIVNEFDEPVEGAAVSAFRSRRGDHPPETALSGPRGAFEVRGLGGKTVRLVVSHALYSTTSVDDVATGSTGLTIRLPRRTGLAGRIVDPAGEPLENFWINVKRVPHPGDMFDIGVHRRYSHEKGRFVVEGLEPGVYRLEVAAKGFAATLSGEVSVPREHFADAGAIAVQRGGSIRGVVRDPSGEALMGAVVALKPNEYRPSYFEEAFGSVSTIRTRPARTDINGRFGMLAVTPGVYQVEVASRAFPPLRIDNVGIGDEAEVDLGDLVMPQGGTLTGRVFTEEGARAAGAKVRIVKDDGSFSVTVTADSDGRFEAAPVPAGTYALTPEFPFREDENFFSAAPPSKESTVKGIVVGEGGSQNVNLTLLRKWE